MIENGLQYKSTLYRISIRTYEYIMNNGTSQTIFRISHTDAGIVQ